SRGADHRPALPPAAGLARGWRREDARTPQARTKSPSPIDGKGMGAEGNAMPSPSPTLTPALPLERGGRIHLLFVIQSCNVCYIMRAITSTAAPEVLDRMHAGFDALSPELQRAACW